MTLLNAPSNTIVLTPLGWTILAFFVLQIIAAAKFINSLYTSISILEKEMKENKRADDSNCEESKKDLEEVKKSCACSNDKLRSEILEKHSDFKIVTLESKGILFKKITQLEEKVDRNKDLIINKHSLMAQGLVRVESDVESLEKRVDKVEK